MSALPSIPWTELAIGADEACKLFNLSKDRFLRTVAAEPTFPGRVNYKPAAWRVGSVLDWRANHPAEKRRRA